MPPMGFWYPSSLGVSNHIHTAIYSVGFEKTLDLNRLVGIYNPRDNYAFKEKVFLDFSTEMNELKNIHTVIISNEHLQSKCLEERHFYRLKKLLGDYFSKITIVCYLRSPLDHAVSLYPTAVRHGFGRGIDSFLRSRMAHYHTYFSYQSYLPLWEDSFGEQNLSIRDFDHAKRLPHGVLSDFLQLADIAVDAADIAFPGRENTSINSLGLRILRNRNKLPNAFSPENQRWTFGVNAWVDKEFSGKGDLPTLEVAEAFVEQFKSAVNWARKKWFGDDTNCLVSNLQLIRDYAARDITPIGSNADADFSDNKLEGIPAIVLQALLEYSCATQEPVSFFWMLQRLNVYQFKNAELKLAIKEFERSLRDGEPLQRTHLAECEAQFNRKFPQLRISFSV